MRDRASRTATLILATTAACLLVGGTAHAQSQSQTAGAGPRYLSWANRVTGTTPADVTESQTAAATGVPARTPNGMIPRRVAPSQSAARPMMQPSPQPVPASRGLTSAGVWMGPRTVPAYAPGSPDPTAYAVADLQPPTAPSYVAPAPTYAPAPSAPSPRPDSEAAPVPKATGAPAADPMAPRRDAPIFRLQPQAPAPVAADGSSTAPTPAAPAQQGARYYSVHRDAGRQPDPTPMPEPVYFDSVTLDLAEPPATEPSRRDAQGRQRVVANDDPSLP